MADFILFHTLIDTEFFVEHIKNAFCYIVENFEECLSNSDRENALRVTCLVNILGRGGWTADCKASWVMSA